MPSIVQRRLGIEGANVQFANPIGIGHVIVAIAMIRGSEAYVPPDDLEFPGRWTLLGTASVTSGNSVRIAAWWRAAEATNEEYDLQQTNYHWALLETDAVGVTPFAVVQDQMGPTLHWDCGGEVTPAEASEALLIGAASVGTGDGSFDGPAGDRADPDANVTEEWERWDGFRPLAWVGYREVASASGSAYTIGATNIWTSAKFWCGITIMLSTDPPVPEVTPPLVCAVDDTDLSELVCITTEALIDWSIRVELQGTGSGYIMIHRTHEAASNSVIKKGNWLATKIPQIDADAIFTFQIERVQTVIAGTEEGGDETVKIIGRGNLSYFDRPRAHARSYVIPSELEPSGILHGGLAGTGNKAGQILKRAVEEYQHEDRGVEDWGLRLEPIKHLTHDFDYDDDSDGNVWTDTDMTEEMLLGYAGEFGLNGVLELIGTGGIDIVMRPNFLLQAYNQYGRDLTGENFGADVVRFVKGVNIAEKLTRDEGFAVDPTHTMVLGQGVYGFAESAVYTDQPHVEGFVQTFGTDPAALEAIGRADMARRLRQGESVQFRVKTPKFGDDPDPENGLYLPGPEGTNGNYWIGDFVTLHTGTGFRDYSNIDVRVMAITITGDDAGDLEVTVELKGTVLTQRLPASAGSAGGFGVGPSASAGGTGGGTPAPPPPSAIGIDHIYDPDDAHNATAIEVADAHGHFENVDNVEEAIEEIVAHAVWKESVRVATTANITISTALNSGDVIDGITLATGDRVLVKDQSSGAENGIYVVGASPGRAGDAKDATQVMAMAAYVREGTTNANTIWINTNDSLPTVGTTALTFAEFSSGGAIDVTDGTTTVSPASEVEFDPAAFAVTDQGGGSALVEFTGAAGGGSFTRTQLGTTSIGGSFDTTLKKVFKKITVPSAGLISAISVAFKGNSSNPAFPLVGIMSDNAGTPNQVIAVNHGPTRTNTGGQLQGGVLADSNARFVTVPINFWVSTPGAYWIVVGMEATSGNGMQLAFSSGTGSDRTQSSTDAIYDHAASASSTGTNDYSVYADFLATSVHSSGQYISRRLFSSEASLTDAINSSAYLDYFVTEFGHDWDQFPATHFRITARANSNASGQSILLQLTPAGAPTNPVSAAGDDITIPFNGGTVGWVDSGWIPVSDVMSGFDQLQLAVKGTNSTVDLVIRTIDIHFKNESPNDVGIGTAFPGSPATNQRFYRTDLGGEYFYDGARWLSTTLHHAPVTGSIAGNTGFTANTLLYAPVSAVHSEQAVFLERLRLIFYASGLSGSAYWSGQAVKVTPAEAQTNVGSSVTIQSGTSSNYLVRTTDLDAVLDLSSHPVLGVNITKTGSPGTLLVNGGISYRLVAT